MPPGALTPLASVSVGPGLRLSDWGSGCGPARTKSPSAGRALTSRPFPLLASSSQYSLSLSACQCASVGRSSALPELGHSVVCCLPLSCSWRERFLWAQCLAGLWQGRERRAARQFGVLESCAFSDLLGAVSYSSGRIRGLWVCASFHCLLPVVYLSLPSSLSLREKTRTSSPFALPVFVRFPGFCRPLGCLWDSGEGQELSHVCFHLALTLFPS